MKYDPFKERHGQTFEQRYRLPSFEEVFQKRRAQSKSAYPLRLLGKAAGMGQTDVYISEEEREHNLHIIGTSGMGKSKYLEYHIRKDIDMGFGLCLIDPSDFGATFNAILNYCASINHKKVLIIDPNTLYDYGKIACLQPLNAKFATRSASAVKDAINTLLGSSIANTQTIQENLNALLRMLAIENLTLHEAVYFADYDNPNWKGILDNAKGIDAQTLRLKFKTEAYWRAEFTTTVKRLKQFSTEPLALMLGGMPGIPWKELIDDGWVILCNLFPEPYLEEETSTFLGILIIGQIIRAIDQLNQEALKGNDEGWGKRFYLYIDEAGTFATPQIKVLLNNKRKSGLHLIFAHHYFSQFESRKDVLDAINTNAKVKIMFGVGGHEDLHKMLKQLRLPAEAADTYGNLPKRHFVVRKLNQPATEVISPTVEPVAAHNIEEYIRERLNDPWYYTKDDILKQIASRIKEPINDTPSTNTPPPVEATAPVSETTSDTPSPRRKSLFDLGAEAEEFIRNNKTPK